MYAKLRAAEAERDAAREKAAAEEHARKEVAANARQIAAERDVAIQERDRLKAEAVKLIHLMEGYIHGDDTLSSGALGTAIQRFITDEEIPELVNRRALTAEARLERVEAAAMALYERVEMDESVGICLSSRVEALNLGAALSDVTPREPGEAELFRLAAHEADRDGLCFVHLDGAAPAKYALMTVERYASLTGRIFDGEIPVDDPEWMHSHIEPEMLPDVTPPPSGAAGAVDE
jgi:hypothetical protein